jgi:hypothetical protein
LHYLFFVSPSVEGSIMKRFLSAALVLLAAAAPAFATNPEDLLGTWFFGGDPNQPCYIGLRDRGPRGVIMTFTNAQGQTIEGILRDNWTVVAGRLSDSIGRLSGDPRFNGVISWNTGEIWTRMPDRPVGWNASYGGSVNDWRFRPWDRRQFRRW